MLDISGIVGATVSGVIVGVIITVILVCRSCCCRFAFGKRYEQVHPRTVGVVISDQEYNDHNATDSTNTQSDDDDDSSDASVVDEKDIEFDVHV